MSDGTAIVKRISNAIGTLEDRGVDCSLSVAWETPTRARVRCKAVAAGVVLADADVSDTAALETLAGYLDRLAANEGLAE